MSVVKTATLIIEDSIVTLIRGKRKGRYNFECLQYKSEHFIEKLLELIKKKTWKALYEYMNAPTGLESDVPPSLPLAYYQYKRRYHFDMLLSLIFAENREVVVVDKRGG